MPSTKPTRSSSARFVTARTVSLISLHGYNLPLKPYLAGQIVPVQCGRIIKNCSVGTEGESSVDAREVQELRYQTGSPAAVHGSNQDYR